MPSFSQYAQGKVLDFPKHYEMKSKICRHRSGDEPFRFTLSDGRTPQLVEFVDEGDGRGSFEDGRWFTSLVVCPVGGQNTQGGMRMLHVDVDVNNHATYLSKKPVS